jgi:hypothetical protein|tara:strand:+ start:630 stop:857 length:228 start_codon:yes stop_codon:yes gene_type:complete
MLFLIIDLEVDPQQAGPDGMSAAFIRSDDGDIIFFRKLAQARAECSKQNEGIDLGEPGFAILELNPKTGTQRRVS